MNSEKQIHVVLCEPSKKANIITINNELESFQKAVGGYIEVIYPFKDPVAIICNEEGKINGMTLNRALCDDSGQIIDILAGPFLIVEIGKDDFNSLSKEYRDKYYRLFEQPEMFFRDENKIQSIKLEISD